MDTAKELEHEIVLDQFEFVTMIEHAIGVSMAAEGATNRLLSIIDSRKGDGRLGPRIVGPGHTQNAVADRQITESLLSASAVTMQTCRILLAALNDLDTRARLRMAPPCHLCEAPAFLECGHVLGEANGRTLRCRRNACIHHAGPKPREAPRCHEHQGPAAA